MARIALCIVATLALAAVFSAAPAQAQNGTLTRSFVSSAGVDSNPCTIAQPCATFAHAYTAIGANGIIAALDPGKYGPITITGPVTVNGNGWAAITGPASGTAITINAVSGNVILTGLEIDGAGAAYNGIVFNSGSSLTVTNCILLNFIQDSSADQTTGNGILIQPGNNLLSTISNIYAANNGNDGIQISGGPNNAGLSNIIATNNQNNGFEFHDATSASLSNVRADASGRQGIYVSTNTGIFLVIKIRRRAGTK